jgi:FimV-like protein
MQRGYRGPLHRPLLMLMLLLLVPVMPVVAVSLGDMVVLSTPGEPLRAHIPLSLQADESLAELQITLATVEEYAQRDIPRAGLLQGLRLALLDRGNNSAHLQLFGEQPWQGEAAQLLLMVSWPQGQMTLPYKLAAVSATEKVTPVYVEVAPNETLDQIAIRLSNGRNRSYLHMMYALFLANPDAFYRGNMNNLKTGSTLRVPGDEELYALSDREVFEGIRKQHELWQPLRESKPEGVAQAGAVPSGTAAGLKPSDNPDALQQQLQQVIAESEIISRENEALRQRLLSLEQRMQGVAGQVLGYADDEAPVKAPSPSEQQAEALPAEEKEEGLPASALFAAIVLVLLFVFYIWYSTGHPHRGRS